MMIPKLLKKAFGECVEGSLNKMSDRICACEDTECRNACCNFEVMTVNECEEGERKTKQ